MRSPFSKFFADRGTHLAAMIAYFALLSFVPLVFLALSLLGVFNRIDESSFFVTELSKAFPGTSIDKIVSTVRKIQDNAAALGVLGGVFLAWSSLSLFSVLESAFNIVYGRPNRSFLRGKAVAVVVLVGSLVTLFIGLLAGSIGYDVLKRFAPGFISNGYVAYTLSVSVSLAAVFLFILSAYYFLTNERLTVHEVLPGALVAALVLEASFQVLPVYLRLADNATAVKAFAGPALLLLWLYVMANVIVFGAEINYWLSGRGKPPEEIPGLA
ncbi:MAG TPA: YihY/virulence factor BrkB family protein [Gaiellaceae bacterium]